MAIKLYYNKTTYVLIGIDDNGESIIQGDSGSKEFQFYFGTGTTIANFVHDATWVVTYEGRVLLERPDGITSNYLYATPITGLLGGYYKLVVTDWISEVEGNLLITARTQILVDSEYVATNYGVATIAVEYGIEQGTDATIAQAQYEAIQTAVDGVIAGTTPIAFDNTISGLAAVNIKTAIDEVDSDLDTHIADVANPHVVTKTQLVIENVDNTSDVNKPVSTAQQTALDLKSNITYVDSADALKVDKTATIIGIDLQNNIELAEFKTALGNATTLVAGLMTSTQFDELAVLTALLATDDVDELANTIGEILAIFDQYPEGTDLVTALAAKVDKVTGKSLLSDTEITRLLGIETTAEVNIIEQINVNDVYQAPTARVVNIDVPTKTSDIINDGDGTSDYVTADALGTAGYGDMTEAEYATNGVAGKVDLALLAEGLKVSAPFEVTATVDNRISGGNATEILQQDLMTKNAKVLSIKGLTVENKVTNGDFASGTTGWTLAVGTPVYSVISGKLNIKNTSFDTSGIKYTPTLVIGHKYYLRYDYNVVLVGSGSNVRVALFDTNYIGAYNEYTTASSGTASMIRTVVASDTIIYVRLQSTTNPAYNEVNIDNVQLINLTEIFGSGNEPTTTAEVEAYLTGEYISSKQSVQATAISSVSENMLPIPTISGVTLISGDLPIVPSCKVNVGYTGTPTSIALTYKTQAGTTISTETKTTFSGTTEKYANFTVPALTKLVSIVITPSEAVNAELLTNIKPFMKFTEIATVATGNANATTYSEYKIDVLTLPTYTMRSAEKSFDGYANVTKITNGGFDTVTTGWDPTTVGTPTVTSGIVSFTATARNGRIQQLVALEQTKVYYVQAKVKANSTDVVVVSGDDTYYTTNIVAHSGSGNFETLSGLFSETTINSASASIQIRDYRYDTWAEIQADYVIVVCLTDLYNTGILTSIPSTATAFEQLVIRDELDLENLQHIQRVDTSYAILATPVFTALTTDNDYVAHNFGIEHIELSSPIVPTTTVEYPIDTVTQVNTNTEFIAEHEKTIATHETEITALQALKTTSNKIIIMSATAWAVPYTQVTGEVYGVYNESTFVITWYYGQTA